MAQKGLPQGLKWLLWGKNAPLTQKWANMLGIIISYPGRVFGNDLIILGLLWGASAILATFLPQNSNFHTPADPDRCLEKA